MLDLRCDELGSNALAPLYFDASVDTTLQLQYLIGKHMVVNPPFKMVMQFLELVEKAFEAS